MIEPEDIGERARRLWSSGRVLAARVTGEPMFPWVVPFAKPSAEDWLHRFAAMREWVERIARASKAVTGVGYELSLQEIDHRKLGRVRRPERIQFASAEDLAAGLGETENLERFDRIAERVLASQPALLQWLATRPFVALARSGAIDTLLEVTAHLQAHPRPMRFARELGIPGVDSKFIELHQGVLREWLDSVLLAAHIDRSVAGAAEHGFERRFGLRFEEASVRFRWLDQARALDGALMDARVPLREFASYAPACRAVFITENKVSFLTLPAVRDGLGLFGGGYAIEQLAAIPWLGHRRLFYWGDIDTHGFAILSRLRAFAPHAKSMLMDRDTLLTHRKLWTEEPETARSIRDLPDLTADETALYDDLRCNRFGLGIRLEQERVAYARVETAVADCAREE